MVYDIFYVSKNIINEQDWKQFRLRFPSAQKIDNLTSFDDIKKKAFTKFFWVIWDDLTLIDLSIFDFKVSKFEEEFIHVFKNRCNDVESYFGGVVLFPKNCTVSSKEFQHKFYLNKKEHDVVVSEYRYPISKLTTYDAYLKFATSNPHPLFWGVWADIEIINEDIFNLYFDPNDGEYDYDRNENHVYKNSCNNVESYLSGVVLFSTKKIISEREFNIRFLVDKKEHDIVVSKYRYPRYVINNYQEYQDILKNETCKMFWCIWPDIEIVNNDIFDLYFDPNDGKYDYDRNTNHLFLNNTSYDGLILASKNKLISKKEFDCRFLVDKKEWNIVATKPKPFDVYYLNAYEEFLSVKESATSEMFWVVWNDVNLSEDFVFGYYVPVYDTFHRNITHVFKNGECYDGICLFSKHKDISKNEFEHRFFVDKVEVDVVASTPKHYDQYIISNYDDYLAALTSSCTEMFWGIWANVNIANQKIFDTYFSHHDRQSRIENHVFKNACNDQESFVNGVTLFSKNTPVSKKEIDHKFLINKKEYNIVASQSRYPKYIISSYDEYLNICQTEKQPLFWCVWSDIDIIDNEIFNFYFDPFDGQYDHDRTVNHMFKNKVNNEESYISGVSLCCPTNIVSKKEFDHRFFIDKKEHNLVVSKSKPYDKFVIEKFEDYNHALKTSTTDMFWVVPTEVEPLPDFKFDLQFSYQNNYERSINHVFKNKDVEEDKYNGIMLLSKQAPISSREVEYRYLIEKKEYDVVASELKLYDIVFISYNEPNADENFAKLIERFPRAKRVHGVKGIHQAHIAAAKLSITPMFWAVDGDAVIEDNFKFNLLLPKHDTDIVHVWLSRNPVNDLKYGYGGVKLLPKLLTEKMNVNQIDMTMSISNKFKVVQQVSNITAFNTDPFNTWKSAFRECVKLASRPVDPGYQEETEDRLHAWCILGGHRPNGKYAIQGAKAGKQFGIDNIANSEELTKINDFDWLLEQFHSSFL